MIAATPEEQRRLLDLQHVDTEIRRLEHRRANLDEQKALEENAETLGLVAEEYASNRDTFDRLARDQKRHEDEVATLETRRKTEEAQMWSGRITNEREAEALRAGLGQLRGRKNDLEDALLEIMEQREELEGVVTTLKERHAELSGRVDDLTVARDAAAKDLDAQLTEQGSRRTELLGDVRPELLTAYDALRARKGGVAVAELERRTCTGCRLQLTELDIDDVHETARRGLATCEQCGRFLVLPAPAPAASPE